MDNHNLKDGSALRLARQTMETDVVIVTPKIAQKWIGTQVRNRPEQTISMLGYRADMLAGRWEFAGDPIRFDKDGHLIDGYNRLSALAGIENDGFALAFLVIRGLNTDAQLVMDQGARRTAGQQLGLKGIVSGTGIAAGVRMSLSWERDLLFANRWEEGNQITPTEVIVWVEEHPEEVRIALARLTSIRKIGLRPSSGLGFVIRLGVALENEVKEFITEMDELANLPEGSPTLALAKRLARVRREPDLRLSEIDQLGFLIYTWNNWINGRHSTRLQRPRGGWNADTFPHPDGI